MKMRTIRPEERIPIWLDPSERDLILQKTPANAGLRERLREARFSRGRLKVSYSLIELDELLGSIAVEANHSDDWSLVAELDRLYIRLETIEGTYNEVNGKRKAS